MKLSKALLGALVVGLTVQTTACNKKEAPGPKDGKGKKEVNKTIDNCPGCGLG